jgi:AcrR family transcriptional regulator
MPNKALTPQQARSRESLSKLLTATAKVLQSHGLEGATIPRIAKQAGLSAGSVYRRFEDKDALLEAVILHMMQRQEERLSSQANIDAIRQIPLPSLARQSFRSMLTVYRANAGFLRAARRFAEMRTGTAFYRKVDKLERRAFERARDIFLLHREQMTHPDPGKAVALALLMVASAVREVAFADKASFVAVLPADDDALAKELVRAFLRYVGAPEQ